MSESTISPQTIYDRLIGQSIDSRRKRSLAAVHEACGLLHERGSTDFSYKNIVNLGKDRGLPIPGEKSIVNSTGVHYRELIQAWKLTSVPSRPKARTDDWIDHISDPVVRMSVTLLAKELRALKAKDARKSQQSSAPIILGVVAGQAVSKQLRLNGAELESLKAAIDPARLGLVGLTIGQRGEILDGAGRQVHKPGFRDAIEKILSVQVK
ncbi:gamma-mobile-trio protein GmtX [Pseudomonas sp. SDO5271_S396]